MPSHYSIVQFVPSSGERVNVGVFATDGATFHTHFVQNLNRLRNFAGGASVHAINDFRKSIPERLNVDEMRSVAERFHRSIQLTEPRASTLSVRDLLFDIAGDVLIDPPISQVGEVYHASVRADTKRTLRRALQQKYGGQGVLLLREKRPIKVDDKTYRFDLAIGNGTPLHLVDTLSFRMRQEQSIERSMHATAWNVRQVKERYADLPVTVVAAEPEQSDAPSMELYRQSKEEIIDLKAGFEPLSDVQDWAFKVAEGLPLKLAAH